MPINMSHCRFSNTRDALQECIDALDDALDPLDPLDALSEAERAAAIKLIEMCGAFWADYKWTQEEG